MKPSLWNPSWKYTPADKTDVSKTIRKEQKRLKSIADQERANEQEAAVKVSQLKKVKA